MVFLKDPLNLGYEVERKFFNSIKQCNFFIDIKSEKDLKKLYGWDLSSIDYLIITTNGIIPIQIKYRRTRRKETHCINNFLKSIDHLPQIYEKPILFGVWISRMSPFMDNQTLLESRKIQCVSYFDDIDILIKKSIEHIHTKFINAYKK